MFVFTCSALLLSVLCGLVFTVKLQSGQNQDTVPPDLHVVKRVGDAGALLVWITAGMFASFTSFSPPLHASNCVNEQI